MNLIVVIIKCAMMTGTQHGGTELVGFFLMDETLCCFKKLSKSLRTGVVVGCQRATKQRL